MPQHPDDGVQLDGREDGERHDQRPLPRDAEQQRERRDVAGQGVEPQKRLRTSQREHGEVAQRDQRHAADERDEGRRAAEAALRQRVHDEQRNDKPGQTQHERRRSPSMAIFPFPSVHPSAPGRRVALYCSPDDPTDVGDFRPCTVWHETRPIWHENIRRFSTITPKWKGGSMTRRITDMRRSGEPLPAGMYRRKETDENRHR